MLSNEVLKLENENQKLKELLIKLDADIPKKKDCRYCKNYIQYYCRDRYGSFHIVYTGHCICGMPIRKRKGKKNPSPEDTCLCFEAIDIKKRM